MRHPLSYWSPELPAALVRLVRKCTRANPDERYASCTEIAAVLQALQKNEQSLRADILK
jgi:serine/threonine-protein kinase